VAFGEEGVALLRQLGDRPRLALALAQLGMPLRDYRAFPRGREVLEEAVALGRELQDRETVALALYHLASIFWYERYADRPIEGAGTRESARQASEQPGLALELSDVSAPQAGDSDDAVRMLNESLAIYRQRGDAWGCGMVLVGGGGLAFWAWATGDYTQAAASFAEGIRLYHRLRDDRSVADALNGLARVALSAGDAWRAARLFAAADAIYETGQTGRMRWAWPTWEEDRRAVRARLSAHDFAAAWAEGRAMTLEQAVAYALEDAG
jgi:tetratricopeptide (TPR) repeat protein